MFLLSITAAFLGAPGAMSLPGDAYSSFKHPPQGEPACPKGRYVLADYELDCRRPGCMIEDISKQNTIVVSSRNLRRAPITTMREIVFGDRELFFPVPSYMVSMPCPIGDFFLPLDAHLLDFVPIEADGNPSSEEYLLRFRLLPKGHNGIVGWEKEHLTPIEDRDRVWLDREIHIVLFERAKTLDFENAFEIQRGLASNVSVSFPEMSIRDFDGDGIDDIVTAFSMDELSILSVLQRSGYSYSETARCGIVVEPGSSNTRDYGFRFDAYRREFTCYGPDHQGGRAAREIIGLQ